MFMPENPKKYSFLCNTTRVRASYRVVKYLK
jgi:hypothetical protein